jgi:hypothetical protein
MRPNLFHYAARELSQDAIICWLLAWADQACEAEDVALHQVGHSLVSNLLKLQGVPCPKEIKVKVHQQALGADIVAEVGEDCVLLIEDKVDAGLHGDQLQRYQRKIAEKFAGRSIVPVYVKTGDQWNYTEAEKAGYNIFVRHQILELLRPWKDTVSDTIFVDFLAHLEERESETESYATKPVSAWTKKWDPWKGFYKRLQCEFPGGVQWNYVANPRGGFLGAWWGGTAWHDADTGGKYDVYLQIEASTHQAPLCFKISAYKPDIDRGALWERWFAKLAAAAKESGLKIKRANRRPGTWMTVGRVELADWMIAKSDGLLDLERTLNFLRSAASVVVRAAAAGTMDQNQTR